jgi:DNA-binding LacI/PurR family transcriptional regulator
VKPSGGKDLKYQRIIGELKRQILEGALRPHGKVPSTKQLQEIYGVSSITAIRALRDLTAEGVIYQKPGVGSFVTDRGIELAGSAHGSPLADTVRTRLIGLVFSQILDSFYPEVIDGIEEVLNPDGYHLILKQTKDDMRTEFHHLDSLMKEGVAGIILACSADDVFAQNVKFIRDAAKCPFVVIDSYLENMDIDGVVADEVGGAASAVKYLASLGHRKIAHISGKMGDPTAVAQLKGYQMAMTEAGLPLSPKLVHGFGLARRDGYESMRHFLEMEDVPTGVFCASDRSAAGAYQAIYEAGLRVGSDISVVGFGDVNLATRLTPPLTSIHRDGKRLGRVAAEMLLRKIEASRVDSDGRMIFLETQLVERKSCSPPKQDPPQ